MSRGSLGESTLAETLYRVAQAVADRDDLHEIVQVVTDEATAITGAQFGAFFYNVVDRSGESYSLYTISGVPRERFEKFPMPRNTDVFRPTFEGSGTLRLDDVTADRRYGNSEPYYGMPPGHLPVRSYLAVSVFNRTGDVVGGLFFGHETTGVFTAEHERIAEAIAAHAGVAVEKAQLLEAERAARAEAEARADAAVALSVVGDGVALVDRQGVVRLWNRAAESITGLRAAFVLGRPIGHAVPGWERIVLRIPLTAENEPAVPATLPLSTVEGGEIWLSLYGIAFAGGTVYAFRDVTDQRELDALRNDTIATVSHELRTPIASVYGAARTLRNRTVDTATREQLLELIDTESARLAGLVEEILLTSQIDAGRISVAQKAIDPARTVELALSNLDAPGVTVELDPALPTAAGDPEKLRQVVANLVENALKYGREPVTVRVVAGRRIVRFDVSDAGDGIPAHEQKRIFEKFHRLERHLNGGVRGTGLGLYICRELIERMHGRIGVDSREAHGATFWLELPRYDDRTVPTEPTEPTASAGGRHRARAAAPGACTVVICDDQPGYRRVVDMALSLDERIDVVAQAENGEEAIAAVGAHRPDVLLLDVAMPVMDGLEALPQVLERSPETKVIVLTGLANEGVRSAALAAGAVRFLEKGIDPAALAREVKDVAGLS